MNPVLCHMRDFVMESLAFTAQELIAGQGARRGATQVTSCLGPAGPHVPHGCFCSWKHSRTYSRLVLLPSIPVPGALDF